MEQQTSAGIVTYYQAPNKEREYLLLHYNAGHWDLPKGHVEPGETHEQAALRELQEETGLHAELDANFTHTFAYNLTNKQGEPAHKAVYWFVGKTDSKKVIISHEHKGFVWLPYTAAVDKLTYLNAQKLLKEAELFLEKKLSYS